MGCDILFVEFDRSRTPSSTSVFVYLEGRFIIEQAHIVKTSNWMI